MKAIHQRAYLPRTDRPWFDSARLKLLLEQGWRIAAMDIGGRTHTAIARDRDGLARSVTATDRGGWHLEKAA